MKRRAKRRTHHNPVSTEKLVVAIGLTAVVAGGIGLAVYFAKRKPADALPSGGVTDADIDAVFQRALTTEKDPDILRAFSSKLRAAGRDTQADQLVQRAIDVDMSSGGTQARQTIAWIQQAAKDAAAQGKELVLQQAPNTMAMAP